MESENLNSESSSLKFGACCHYLLELTRQETFSELDRTLVQLVGQCSGSTGSALFLGNNHDSETRGRLLAAWGQMEALDGAPGLTIALLNGQLLVLVFDGKTRFDELDTLIAVYIQQHQHLTRSGQDSLTGLKNRRSFDIEYVQLFARMVGHHQSHVLAVLDVDHFKQVNDQYGHLIGDETLIAIANLMKEFFKRPDCLYRFGGEEFILLLQNTSLDKARVILDELRKTIASYRFPQLSQLTVSIGAVQIDAELNSTTLFERADAALYMAKDCGRNNVQCYQDLVASGRLSAIDNREGEIDLF